MSRALHAHRHIERQRRGRSEKQRVQAVLGSSRMEPDVTVERRRHRGETSTSTASVDPHFPDDRDNYGADATMHTATPGSYALHPRADRFGTATTPDVQAAQGLPNGFGHATGGDSTRTPRARRDLTALEYSPSWAWTTG